MNLKKYVFWEPIVSPHKHDLFEAYAQLCDGATVICVAHEDLSKERKQQGWSVNFPINYEQVVSPSCSQISSFIDGAPDVLHVFSGIRHVPTIVAALRLVKERGARFAIMSEPRVAEGWRGLLRFAQSWLTEGWMRQRASFVLAIGRNGPPWFLSVGYSKKRVFPFAYFVNPVNGSVVQEPDSSVGIVTVGFVGRVTRRKGAHDLIEALAKCSNVKLMMIGTGELVKELRARSTALGLSVDFLGVRPISEIPALMRKMDVLVLPSITKDGWGVVVSEALLVGTAVIASTCVGASVVLDDRLLGLRVKPNAPGDIARAVDELGRSGAYTSALRYRRQVRARQMLTGAAGAQYLLGIVNYSFFGGDRPTLFSTWTQE